MGMQARLSLWGMLTYDDSLLDGMALPEDFTDDDKSILCRNLAIECADFEVLYSDWNFLKAAIDAWSAKEVVTWERLYKLAMTEYNPIENYNRTESIIEQHSGALTNSGQDTVANTGIDSTTSSGFDSDVSSGSIANAHTGTDTNTISKTAYESGTLATTEQDALLHGETVTETFNNATVTHNKGTTESLTHGKTETVTHGKTETDSRKFKHDIHAFGNIGVTTSQQMAEQELEVSPKLNIFNIIIESFKNRFCLQVY